MSILSRFTNISIALPQYSNAWRGRFFADICEAARTGAYVETYGNKADTLHKYICLSDSRVFKHSYEIIIRDLISKLHMRNVELAIDGKKDLYYGKQANANVRGIKPDHGADEAWEYIVISIIHPVKLPLMAIPYPMGADIAKCCIELLEYARHLPIRIQKVLFDRGFYNGHLIDYLESKEEHKPLPYLIFVPKNQAIENYTNRVNGCLGTFKHVIKYSREKSSWETPTTIVICKNAGKNEKGEPYDWCFATNLKPSYKLVQQYRMRWNIETGFRIMESGKVMTKSNNPVIRHFYFLLRALLMGIWVLSNIVRVFMTFKRFLKEVQLDLERFVANKPPPIRPMY